MKIPEWMLIEEMKLTNHYRMYATIFRVDVPMTQSQPIESTQGTHRTSSAPILTLKLLKENLVLNNVEKVKEHMMDEELEQLLEGTENVNVDEFMDDIINNQESHRNRIDLESYKESPEPKKSDDNVEEESTRDEFPIKRRENRKGIEELMVIAQDVALSLDKEKLKEMMIIDPTPSSSTPSSSSPKPKTRRLRRYKSFIQQMGGHYGYMFGHLKKHLLPRKKFHQLAKHLHSTMEEFLPLMVGDRFNEIAKKTILLYVVEGLLLGKQRTQADVATMIDEAVNYIANNILRVHPTQAPVSSAQDLQYQLYQMMKNDEKLHNDKLSIWWLLKIKFEKPVPPDAPCRTAAIRLRDHDGHYDDAHPEGGITYDDEVPTKEVSPELMEQISKEIDEAQPQKAINDMLKQRWNSGEEQQYHVDQMQNFLKNNIVWESRKERLSLQTPKKPSPVYHSCQIDPKAPPMTLLNQDIFYLKCGNSRPKKYTLSLYNYLAVPFPDDDI
uniref:Uncharacterized protein n=1 Tax=Tanacetum cinerariifolium TaxID=118510 RepID=A0A699H796_TANCI|nr:hypothetical protein [Tanacetum cinerariifolium]GEX53652.1 hypothetical protein [Tanacetum cinerariifolium]